MRSRSCVVLAATLLGPIAGLGAAAAPAAAPRDALVVSTAWLAAHLGDPHLVLLHVGAAGDFDNGHIPGAHEVKLPDISVRQSAAGLSLEMLPLADLKPKLEALGVSNDSHVVVYSSGGAFSAATRVIETFDYAGLGGHVSWLNGAFEAWRKEGQPVTSAVAPVKRGTLAPLAGNPIVVDGPFVLSHLETPGITIIDARDPIFYEGRNDTMGGMHKRLGHIAGARSLPYSSILDDTTLKNETELRALFTKAGVKPGDTVIAYCHIGQQATTIVFAARTLGITAKLYDGSFTEWETHPDWPVDIK